MVNVVGVRFQNAGKLYFFNPGENWPTPGDYVVVETTRGTEIGEVIMGVHEIDDTQLSSPLKPVIRIASAEDIQHVEDNKKSEKEAYQICQKKIEDHKLDMKLVSVEYTFDNSKILFYFTANGRVDFRSLVKDLAGVFHTRIELRQIGVRDEAKMIGGLGPCGRPICCGTFLGDFQPVSIKMAKEQNLSLNPTKISGVCGRLMCCLKYEEDVYEETRKKMPRIGKQVITPEGNGVVWDLNIIKETVKVRLTKGDTSELKDFPMEEIQKIGGRPKPLTAAEEETASAVSDQHVESVSEEAPLNEEQSANSTEVDVSNDQVDEKKPASDEHQPRPEKKHGTGKPVMRENRHRDAGKHAAHNDKDKKQQNEKKTAAQTIPAQKNKQEAPKQVTEEKSKGNSWKQAVDEALRAARSQQNEK